MGGSNEITARTVSAALCRSFLSVRVCSFGRSCLFVVLALSCVFVSSPAGQSLSIAKYAATPVESPPTFSLITPGDSAGGVQLSFTNGVVSGKSTQLAMQFKCTVRHKRNKSSCWRWRL